MATTNGRMAREERTMEAMVRLFCAARHSPAVGLCSECAELLAYAKQRLDRCPFQERKSACGKCTVHCYRPAMRERVREVMRFAGPRMLRRHPVLAVLHLIDSFRRAPPAPKAKGTKG